MSFGIKHPKTLSTLNLILNPNKTNTLSAYVGTSDKHQIDPTNKITPDWASSNTSLFNIGEDGVLNVVNGGRGSATITATWNNISKEVNVSYWVPILEYKNIIHNR